ncbi:copper resistance CopC family protein [Alkalihalobacterium bogoriense]|uniref:copper resistance CopC family protein n=1 Tax=Alkalihalobacterium bogoriense TaxID=246272 RepID=UPI00047AED77|nr:copper resistance protein CopC [Alkalihalobacterium bogoriense]
MKLKIILLFFLMMFIPSFVFAHSYVYESYPGDGEVVDEAVEQLELSFDAGIESHSTLSITKDDGTSIVVESIEVDSPVLIAQLEEPLYEGNYTVVWEALGADGHGTSGSYSFSVTAEQPQVEVEEEPAEVVEEELTDKVLEEEQSELDPVEAEETEQTTNIWLLVLGLAALIAVLFIIIRVMQK